MQRKTYIQIAAVIIVVLVVAGALYNYVYVPSLPKTLTKINVVFMVPLQYGYWELLYANETGFYREEGLQVEVTIVKSPKEMTQALVSGDVDFSYGMGEFLRAYLAGVQIKVVAVTMLSNFALFVKPEANSIQDVKSIAVPGGRGGDSDIMTREYLIQHGLKPEEDVSLVYVQSTSMTAPAFIAGQVDAFIGGPSDFRTVQGKAKILFQYAKEFPRWYINGIVVTEKTIAERPEVVKGFVRAVSRSQVALFGNKEKAIQYAVDVLKLDRNLATLIYEYQYEGKYGAATKIVPAMPVDDLRYSLEMNAKYMGVPMKPVEDMVDTSFLEQ